MITEDTFSYWYKATVQDVYDGDSITVELDYGWYKFQKNVKIRFLQIDAPELRGVERIEGLAARDALRGKLPIGSAVIINTFLDREDKYGRLLAIVYIGGENVNLWMLENGHAEVYMEMKV